MSEYRISKRPEQLCPLCETGENLSLRAVDKGLAVVYYADCMNCGWRGLQSQLKNKEQPVERRP